MQNEIQLNKGSFEHEVYQKMCPAMKSFLSAYLGDKLLHLEPKSYSEIETAIQKNIFYYASNILSILYRYRTIKDEDEWDHALDSFERTDTEIIWSDTEHWFDRDFGSADDNDSFLEDAYDFELNDGQQQAKKIVEIADTIINDTQNFALFMRAGYQVLNATTRQFLKDFAIFDLTILSEDGFQPLQDKIDMMIEMILEDLFSTIQY